MSGPSGTDLQVAPGSVAYEGPADPPSPPARRLRAPSWLDLRLVLGVLLVLVAVVVGARVLAGADKSTAVWGLAHGVARGTAIQDADLRRVKVRFFSDRGPYLPATTSPIGLVAARDLHAGELLSRTALRQVPTSMLVPLPVPPAQVPPDLGHGDRVNVWAGSKNDGGTGHAPPHLILTGAAVQSVGDGGSGLSTSNTVQVTLRIGPSDERALVAAVAGSQIYLVQDLGDEPHNSAAPAAPHR